MGMKMVRVCQGVRGGCHGLGLVMEPILVGHEILRYLHRRLCMSCLVELVEFAVEQSS